MWLRVEMYAGAESGSVVVCLLVPKGVRGRPVLGSAGRACPGDEAKVIG